MKPSEILRKAKALINTPEKWTQGGFEVEEIVDGVNIRKFSADGVIYHMRLDCILHKQVFDILRLVMKQAVAKFNDTHTHAEVMAKWDEAIALAEADEKEIA